MQKKYIAPDVEVSECVTSSIICTSADSELPVFSTSDTTDQW